MNKLELLTKGQPDWHLALNKNAIEIDERHELLTSFLPEHVIDDVPMAELQNVIDGLGKFLNRNVTINVLPGTFSGELRIEGFCGGGGLTIVGATSTANATPFMIERIYVGQCRNDKVEINGFNINATTGNAVNVINTNMFAIHWCSITGGNNTASGNVGINVTWSTVGIGGNSVISNKSVAINAVIAHVDASTVSGTDNGISYQARHSGTIAVRMSAVITGNRFCLEEHTGRIILGANVTWQTTMPNLQNAVNGIPSDIGRFEFTIQASPGTFTGMITRTRVQGSGVLNILGATSIASTHTITGASGGRMRFDFITTGVFLIAGFNLSTTSPATNTFSCIIAQCSALVLLRHMRVVNAVLPTVVTIAFGTWANAGNVLIENTEVSRFNRCFQVSSGVLQVGGPGLPVIGTGNAAVYHVEQVGTIIAHTVNTITGTTLRAVFHSGMVRTGATLLPA